MQLKGKMQNRVLRRWLQEAMLDFEAGLEGERGMPGTVLSTSPLTRASQGGRAIIGWVRPCWSTRENAWASPYCK